MGIFSKMMDNALLKMANVIEKIETPEEYNPNRVEKTEKEKQQEIDMINFMGLVKDADFEGERGEIELGTKDLSAGSKRLISLEEVLRRKEKQDKRDYHTPVRKKTEVYSIDEIIEIKNLKTPQMAEIDIDPQYFPPNTKFVNFEALFNEIYTNVNAYKQDPDSIYSKISNYLKRNLAENCVIQLSENELLFLSKNNDRNGIDYNVSYIDEQNNTKHKLIYEENGETYGLISNVNLCFNSEVDYFLEKNKQHNMEIGKIPLEYLNQELYYNERIDIKNQILMMLYDSGKYSYEQLHAIKWGLEKDLNVNCFTNPNFSSKQMYFIMDYMIENETDYAAIKNLEIFNLKIAPNYKYQFSNGEFGVIFDIVLKNEFEKLKDDETKAEMKYSYYTDCALGEADNIYEFSMNNRSFVMYCKIENSEIHTILSEKEINGEGEVELRKIYELKDNEEYGSKQEFYDLYIEKHNAKENEQYFDIVLNEVYAAINSEENENDEKTIKFEDNISIKIQGIKIVSDSVLNTSITTGVNIVFEKDGKEQLIYSDDKSLNIENTIDDVKNFIKSFKRTQEYEIITSSFICKDTPAYEFEDPFDDNSTFTFIKNEDYKGISNEQKVNEIINRVLKENVKLVEALDNFDTVEYVPVTYKDGEEEKQACCVYKQDANTFERSILFEIATKEIDGKNIPVIKGSIEDIVEFYDFVNPQDLDTLLNYEKLYKGQPAAFDDKPIKKSRNDDAR